MASRWTEEILDGFAAPVSYTIRVGVSQLEGVVVKYGNTIPEGFKGPHEDALLEAGLVHLRALDDFFKGGQGGRGTGRPPDIRASDWLGASWVPSHWLDPRVRSQIDWKIVHLSSLSGMDFPDFQVANLGAALCDEIERFFQAVEKHCDAGRLTAFELLSDPRRVARAARPTFAAYL